MNIEMELLVATHNEHKKEEIQQILGNECVVKSLTDYNIHEEIVEEWRLFSCQCPDQSKILFRENRNSEFRRRQWSGSGIFGWKTWNIFSPLCRRSRFCQKYRESTGRDEEDRKQEGLFRYRSVLL